MRIQSINEIAKMKTHALAIGAFMTARLPSAGRRHPSPHDVSYRTSIGWLGDCREKASVCPALRLSESRTSDPDR